MESFDEMIAAMSAEVRKFRKELGFYSPDKVYTKNLDDSRKALYAKTSIKVYKEKAEEYLGQRTIHTHITCRIIIFLLTTGDSVTKQDIAQQFSLESWDTISYYLRSLRKDSIIYVPK